MTCTILNILVELKNPLKYGRLIFKDGFAYGDPKNPSGVPHICGEVISKKAENSQLEDSSKSGHSISEVFDLPTTSKSVSKSFKQKKQILRNFI